MLAAAAEAALTAREIGRGARGRLRAGFVGSFLFGGLPQWLKQFQEAHPGIEVALIELNSQEQLHALGRGDLDAGFVLARRVPPTLQVVTVHEAPFVACLPKGHAAASSRRLSLARLRDEPLVLFSRQVSPDYHARIIEDCAEAGFDPSPARTAPLALGRGLGFAGHGRGDRARSAGSVRHGRRRVPTVERHKIMSTLQCVWPQSPAHSSALTALLAVVTAATD